MTEASVSVDASADRVRVTVTGEIDLANADEVERRLAEAISNQVEAAAVDLAGVEYIDSVGIRVLFTLVARLDTAQIACTFVAPVGSPARRVMELSGFADAVSFDPAE